MHATLCNDETSFSNCRITEVLCFTDTTGQQRMWVPAGTHFPKQRMENTEFVKSSFYYVTVHGPASYLAWRSPFKWVACRPGFVAGRSDVILPCLVDWWRSLPCPPSNMAGAHHFGTESLPLVCKRDMYLGDIWRAYCSAHWTLHVQSTEWNMFTTRNEPLKYGPDEDHYILQGVSSRISLAFPFHSVLWTRNVRCAEQHVHQISLIYTPYLLLPEATLVWSDAHLPYWIKTTAVAFINVLGVTNFVYGPLFPPTCILLCSLVASLKYPLDLTPLYGVSRTMNVWTMPRAWEYTFGCSIVST